MQINVVHDTVATIDADTLIVNVVAGKVEPAGVTAELDGFLDGHIADLLANGDIDTDVGATTVLFSRGAIPARRIVVVGLGDPTKVSLDVLRRAAGAAYARAHSLKANHVASVIHGAGDAGFSLQAATEATAEGLLLAAYRFADFKQPEGASYFVDEVSLLVGGANDVAKGEAGVMTAQAIASGTNLARDLVNLPPNYATPVFLADTAIDIAKNHGLTAQIGDRKWAESQKMGAFLAVAKGAGDEPRFIVLEHNLDRTDLETVVLVGKGITFDTGGISIKPSANMGAMKSDMGGAAAVLGAMKVVGMLNIPLRVIGIAPCTENKPDADAYRPSDVITASNGKSIEIISTDAEGRMALADALVFAGRYNPDAVIDLATLTGAAVTALGRGVAAALFCDDDVLRDSLIAAGSVTHERVWPLPLYEDYRRKIDSPVADMKNSGGRGGGVGTSAVFLREFTDYPWAHLDIAGMALSEKDSAYQPAGGTGFGVRLLVQFLRTWG